MTYAKRPSGWYPFGIHAGWDEVPPLEFSDETDEAGMPLWERPVPADERAMREAFDWGVEEGDRGFADNQAELDIAFHVRMRHYRHQQMEQA